ncbi:MAG: hypothetical protein PHE36_12805 [Novosphingobium sp.]|nr:hypothetical protein [Novosphingobium sp.]
MEVIGNHAAFDELERVRRDGLRDAAGAFDCQRLQRLRRALSDCIVRDGDADGISPRSGFRLASSGWYEAEFHDCQVWSAMRQAAEQAARDGERFSSVDAARTFGAGRVGRNVPASTADAARFARRGRKPGWGAIGRMLGHDAAALFHDPSGKGAYPAGIEQGDAAARIERRTMVRKGVVQAPEAVPGGGRVEWDSIRAVAGKVHELDACATGGVSCLAGALERLGIGGGGQRMNASVGPVPFEDGMALAASIQCWRGEFGGEPLKKQGV